MEVKIVATKENPLLKRKEITFAVDHAASSTPPRMEIRRALANALKSNVDLVFVKKYETRTGMNSAVGEADLYDSLEQAKLVEPEYIFKRNVPPEQPKEEEKKE